MGLTDFGIIFERPSKTYFSGEVINGQLVVSLREGFKKKTKKKVVILLQPPSIYLPTPIGVQKATFLIFF